MNHLVCAVRQGDVPTVRTLLDDKATDVNAMCPVTVRFVEPAGSPTPYAPHEAEVRGEGGAACPLPLPPPIPTQHALRVGASLTCSARVHPTCPQGPLYPTHALFEAARSGHPDIIRALLEQGDLDVNQRAVGCAAGARVPVHSRPSHRADAVRGVHPG